GLPRIERLDGVNRRRCGDFFRPYRKAAERVRTEGRGDRDIRRVAAARDQRPADARDVVARVENVPLTTEIDFEPGREIHRRIRYRHADIAEIAGAIPCRDVHAAAESDREVGKIAADAGTVAIGFPGGSAGTRVLVAKGDVLVNKVADRLDPAPA